MKSTLGVETESLTAAQWLIVLVPRDRDVGSVQLTLERHAAWKLRHSDVAQLLRDRDRLLCKTQRRQTVVLGRIAAMDGSLVLG